MAAVSARVSLAILLSALLHSINTCCCYFEETKWWFVYQNCRRWQ